MLRSEPFGQQQTPALGALSTAELAAWKRAAEWRLAESNDCWLAGVAGSTLEERTLAAQDLLAIAKEMTRRAPHATK